MHTDLFQHAVPLKNLSGPTIWIGRHPGTVAWQTRQGAASSFLRAGSRRYSSFMVGVARFERARLQACRKGARSDRLLAAGGTYLRA